MAINIQVNVDVSKFDQQVINEFIQYANTRLAKLANRITVDAANIIIQAMKETPHYKSLIDPNGKLRVEFGIANPAVATDSILDAVGKSLQVKIIYPKNNSLGGLFLGAYLDDFSDALSADGSKYISVNKSGRSSLIEWLKWLLFEGDAVVIAEYGISQKPAKGSRTGAHIMLPLKRGGTGLIQPWRVPPAFSGQANANWITEAAEIAAPKIYSLLELAGKEVFNG